MVLFEIRVICVVWDGFILGEVGLLKIWLREESFRFLFGCLICFLISGDVGFKFSLFVIRD